MITHALKEKNETYICNNRINSHYIFEGEKMIIAEIAKFWQKLLICSNLLGKLTVMIYRVDKSVDTVVTTELL